MKTCPFCGKDPFVYEDKNIRYYFGIYCFNNQCEIQPSITEYGYCVNDTQTNEQAKEKALSAWNKRA